MSLNLDTRQRAMLAEMGVQVWWPQPGAEVALPIALKAAQDDANNTTKNVAASAHPARATGQNVINSAGASTRPARSQHGTPLPPNVATAPARPAPAGLPQPVSLLPLPDGIDQMDAPALAAAVAHCQACAMCLGRQAAVLMPLPADLRCDWLVLGEPPDDAQEHAGQPFVGEAGQLLDNMLRAVGVRRYLPASLQGAHPPAMRPEHIEGHAAQAASDPTQARPDAAAPLAYLSLVLKCRPARPAAPDAAALATCAHYLRREIALLQPKVILAMGRFAMQVLLSEAHPNGLTLPLGKLRSQVWHYQGVPVVVTYPPAYLLRNGLDKARAWADLCLALDVTQSAAG